MADRWEHSTMEPAMKREPSSDDDDDNGIARHPGPNSFSSSSPDLDRKPPAQIHVQHPFDELVGADLFEDTREQELSSDDVSPLARNDPAHHFRMDLMPASFPVSSGSNYEHHAYHPGYENHYGQSYSYGPAVHHRNEYPYINTTPIVSMPPRPEQLQHITNTHHYHLSHMQSPMVQPPTGYHNQATSRFSTEQNESPPSAQIVSEPTTSTGENSSEVRKEPTQAELDACNTARAREALKTWYKRLGELHQYRKDNGDCKHNLCRLASCISIVARIFLTIASLFFSIIGNVPQKYENNRELGIWVNKQRMEKKAFDENRKSSMTPQKIKALKAIGFQWAKRKGEAAWLQKFNELKKYKRENGTCKFVREYIYYFLR